MSFHGNPSGATGARSLFYLAVPVFKDTLFNKRQCRELCSQITELIQ